MVVRDAKAEFQMRSVESGMREAPLFATRPGCPPPAFAELAMPLFASVYNFAYWLSQDQRDAEDLVQETYLKALRRFDSFEPGTNFRAWIFKILKNTFLSSCSRKRRCATVSLGGDETLPVTSGILNSEETTSVNRIRHDEVRNAIDQLPIIFREIVLLRDVEDASYQEISQILSIPIGTVMSRLFRARKTIRELLVPRKVTSEAKNLSDQIRMNVVNTGA